MEDWISILLESPSACRRRRVGAPIQRTTRRNRRLCATVSRIRVAAAVSSSLLINHTLGSKVLTKLWKTSFKRAGDEDATGERNIFLSFYCALLPVSLGEKL